MLRRASSLCLVVGLLGCAAEGAAGGGSDAAVVDAESDAVVPARDAPSPPVVAGLTLLTEEQLPATQSGTAHLSRLLLRGEKLYGANGSAGVMTWRIAAAGTLAFESSIEPVHGPMPPGPPTHPRCVALSAHPRAPWLYCSAADTGVSRFDLANPDEPVTRSQEALRLEDGIGRPDLYALDDALLVAAFDRGLLRVPIAPDGALGAARASSVTGDVVRVDGDGRIVAALDRARGLLSLRAVGEGLTLRGTLALEGAPLGLRVRGDRAVVALGSSGVWLVDLSSDTPRVLRRVTPPCVATRGDVMGEVLAVACSTGAWLYDLRGTEARVAGFDPSRYGALDVVLRDGGAQLLVADWRAVRVFGVNPEGHATIPDVSLGEYLRAGDGGSILARNVGDLALTLRLEALTEIPMMGLRSVPLAEVAVAPGAVHRFALRGADLARWFDPVRRVARLRVTGTAPESLARNEIGTVYFFEAPSTPPDGRPLATGERFWSWRSTAGGAAPESLPLPGESALALLLPDCALQWGAIEDLAWRLRHRRLTGRATVLSIAFGREPNAHELDATRRRLDAAELGVWPLRAYLPALPQGMSSGEFFETRLSARLLGGGDFTEFYSLSDGVLRATDRIYRGAAPLR